MTNKPKFKQSPIKALLGFTLIEMMLVIMLIGIMATFVQFNAGGDKKEQLLKKSSMRFAGVFELAAEYSMLNNVQLGLLVDKTSYQFLAYDGTRWTDVGSNDLLVSTSLPDGIEIKLELDDLPIEEPLLFDADLLEESGFTNGDDENDLSDEEDELGEEEASNGDDNRSQNSNGSKNKRKKKLIPQVYILSGGDISPFSLTFYFNDDFSNGIDADVDFNEEQPLYRVTGIYSVPLKIEGPKLDDQE
ncbi:MAG: type II secretion system minor pseudopilin GspH [Colwellia sp.]|nr:type II secretion system minor pseudopilin GspH [Colwellia sp.]